MTAALRLSLLFLLGWGEGQRVRVCTMVCAHRGVVGVCVFGVGLVATLKKDMRMCVCVSGTSVTYTYMHTHFHSAMSGIKIAFRLDLQYMMHIIPVLMCLSLFELGCFCVAATENWR